MLGRSWTSAYLGPPTFQTGLPKHGLIDSPSDYYSQRARGRAALLPVNGRCSDYKNIKFFFSKLSLFTFSFYNHHRSGSSSVIIVYLAKMTGSFFNWKTEPEMVRDGVHRLPSTGITILIVGAGVGGLMTACEAWRQGHDVRVLERSPSISAIGMCKNLSD